MGNLKNVVYLSRKNYQDLIKNGQVTVNGVTVFYSDDDIHITPLDRETLTEEEKQKACELIGAVNEKYIDDKIYGSAILFRHRITVYVEDEDYNSGEIVIDFLDYYDSPYVDYDEYYRHQGLELAISRCINPILEDGNQSLSDLPFRRIASFWVDKSGGGYYMVFNDGSFDERMFRELIVTDYSIEVV